MRESAVSPVCHHQKDLIMMMMLCAGDVDEMIKLKNEPDCEMNTTVSFLKMRGSLSIKSEASSTVTGNPESSSMMERTATPEW